jgi:hypothetical protein
MASILGSRDHRCHTPVQIFETGSECGNLRLRLFCDNVGTCETQHYFNVGGLQYMGMHPDTLGFPYTGVPQYWGCIRIYWDTPEDGDASPHTGVPQYMGMHPQILGSYKGPQYMGMHPSILGPWLSLSESYSSSLHRVRRCRPQCTCQGPIENPMQNLWVAITTTTITSTYYYYYYYYYY